MAGGTIASVQSVNHGTQPSRLVLHSSCPKTVRRLLRAEYVTLTPASRTLVRLDTARAGSQRQRDDSTAGATKPIDAISHGVGILSQENFAETFVTVQMAISG